MKYTMVKCDGCGKELRVSDLSTAEPSNWFTVTESNRHGSVLSEKHFCGPGCLLKHAEKLAAEG